MPEFDRIKVTYEGGGGQAPPAYDDIKRIAISKTKDELLFGPQVGSGGNSGFQALNLAIQWGAVRILLVGFDMTDASGLHWYGHNNWRGANNPNWSNFKRWVRAFENAAKQCEQLRVEVINCNTYSALNCFPKMTLEEAVNSRA